MTPSWAKATLRQAFTGANPTYRCETAPVRRLSSGLCRASRAFHQGNVAIPKHGHGKDGQMARTTGEGIYASFSKIHWERPARPLPLERQPDRVMAGCHLVGLGFSPSEFSNFDRINPYRVGD